MANATEVKIKDAYGREGTGYIIGGKTYTDKEGKNRVGEGTTVYTNGGTYKMINGKGVSSNATGPKVNYRDALESYIGAGGKDPDIVEDMLGKRSLKAVGTEYYNDEFQRATQKWVNSLREESGRPKKVNNYNAVLDNILLKLKNKEDFSYNPNDDILYKQYADAYARNGERAMQDTVANIAARTGGLASSYAQTAGQQAYNDYMSALNDKIPELYSIAYNRYQDEYNKNLNLAQLYSALQDRDDNNYYNDMNLYNAERSYRYQKERDAESDAASKAATEAAKAAAEAENARYVYEQEQKQYNQLMNAAIRLYEISGSTVGFERLGFSANEIAAMKLAHRNLQQKKATGKTTKAKYSTTTASPDYDGLFKAAKASGHPENFLGSTTNTKKYGVYSTKSLFEDYLDWEDKQGKINSGYQSGLNNQPSGVVKGIGFNMLAQSALPFLVNYPAGAKIPIESIGGTKYISREEAQKKYSAGKLNVYVDNNGKTHYTTIGT